MEIKVGIVGLGRVGAVFFNKLLEKEGRGVRIVAVADHHEDFPAVREAGRRGIPVYKDGMELIALGEAIDILFDLTGSAGFRQKLREAMAAAGNRHTVIAPETVALLIWALVANGQNLPNVHVVKGY